VRYIQVLVHCTIGASRAPSAVLSYLVYVKGVPLGDAYNLLMVLRPLVQPNQHFLFELAKFEVSAEPVVTSPLCHCWSS
jgi:dual specificity phosphatase 12